VLNVPFACFSRNSCRFGFVQHAVTGMLAPPGHVPER
jgi:hypothetical protein